MQPNPLNLITVFTSHSLKTEINIEGNRTKPSNFDKIRKHFV